MPALRLLGLAAFAALASSQDITTSQEHGASRATKRQLDFFELTGCHPHGDTLFCIHEGDEWEVKSGVEAGTAPDRFEGCHSHSGTEM
jgi:hypothetical protein